MPVTFSKLGQYGRRGNMLFQAAATISLALRNNDDYIFSDCELKGTTNIPLNKFSNNINFNSTYEEPYFHYSPIIYKPNLNLLGYMQSYKYFSDFDNEIKHLLSPNITVSTQEEYTSIHVRRTDYLTHKNCYHILTRQNYYDKAIYVSGGKKFLIFSDDINWCKDNFRGNEFNFSENNQGHVDMKLMASCSNNIIANSSFSYWGAYLNDNVDKKIIYPRIWFGPELSSTHDTKDMFPDSWIRV